MIGLVETNKQRKWDCIPGIDRRGVNSWKCHGYRAFKHLSIVGTRFLQHGDYRGVGTTEVVTREADRTCVFELPILNFTLEVTKNHWRIISKGVMTQSCFFSTNTSSSSEEDELKAGEFRGNKVFRPLQEVRWGVMRTPTKEGVGTEEERRHRKGRFQLQAQPSSES